MADQVRIYALVNPAQLLDERQTITQEVFRILGITDLAAHTLDISESSGWISYVAKEELWRRQYPPILPSAEDARRRAEAFQAAAADATSPGSSQWPKSLERVAMLPRLMRPVQLSVVPRPDGSAWDHWLYRAQPRLSIDASGRTTVPVFGSQIEVRVGDRGQVITFRSRWRPLSGERTVAGLTPFKSPFESESGEPIQAQKDTPDHHLEYVLEGDGIPQHYLAPYYFTSDGDTLRTVSACNYSLTVDIGRTQGEKSMLLTATVGGGSGDYAYNWAIYALDRFDQGYRERGPGELLNLQTDEGRTTISSIEVDNGGYVLMLNVKDRMTGAFKHHQQQVMSTPSIPQPQDESALPVA